MKEQLITFNTAKLAKEKGFKLQSNPFGYVTKFYNHNTGTLLAYGRTGRTDLTKAYYAPTQALLQRWLRKVHKIDLMIKHYMDDIKHYYQVYIQNDIKGYSSALKSKANPSHSPTCFSTYEEALEKVYTKLYYLYNK
tara:strand:+ start:1706 stop:2116 length:411 start_codon:yes stop_codon:yes gene_type:complete